MRLLNVRTFKFTQFFTKTPSYAILSHRWAATEASRADIESGNKSLAGSKKVYGFAEYISSNFPHLEWIWVDSCCINQDSAAELSEGVNCMFEWYQKASICLAFLPDVEYPSDQPALRNSEWFERGWTLQELLAPAVVIFLTNTWQVVGHKGNAAHFQNVTTIGPNLEPLLSSVTGVPPAVLRDFDNSHGLSVATRMQWMEGRRTLREEDMSYALFGIFGVRPGANYGEKKSGARRRLRIAIEEKERPGAGQPAELSGSSHKASSSINNVPFPRDPAFVKRGEMSSIQNGLSAPGARVALAGFGGIGKSQLAIEYCYRLKRQSPSAWVLWVHASSAARFDQDIRKLANDVGIPGREEKDVDIFQLVRGWLNDNQKQWLIVLDNADEIEFLFEIPEVAGGKAGAMSRIDYLSIFSHGSMLITTRTKAAAMRLTDDSSIIVLQPSKAHAVALLQSKLRSVEDDSGIDKLATALEYMPLAIAQAAAYINHKKPRCTVKDFLEKIEKNDGSKLNLLKLEPKESAGLRRDRSEAKNSILLTWHISFEHICATRQSAADLLSLMSFFNYQGIPDFLLHDQQSRSPSRTDEENLSESDRKSEIDTREAFEEDIDMLRDYSFVSETSDTSVLQMHRLVQLAAQLWLKKTDQFPHWEIRSLQRLDDVHPWGGFENWDRCRVLFPHVRLMEQLAVNRHDTCLSLASILFKASTFTLHQGLGQVSERLAERSSEIRTKILGPDHQDTLRSMGNLAITYRSQGRFDEAAELGLAVLNRRKAVLGLDHPDTLPSMGNLASTYRSQGRFDEAAELEVAVLDRMKVVLGLDHPDTLRSMGNLASTYWSQGRFDEAAELEVAVLDRMKVVLGLDHPGTLRSMGNLASTYWSQGRFDEAAELGLAVLDKRKVVLGLDHPDTLRSMENLVSTYGSQGRFDEAAELGLAVLEERKVVLGLDHPDTLLSMGNLAFTYNSQGRFDEAAELDLAVLEKRKVVLGLDHPDTLRSMANLAISYWSMQRIPEAQHSIGRCAELLTLKLGADHPDTRSALEWRKRINESVITANGEDGEDSEDEDVSGVSLVADDVV